MPADAIIFLSAQNAGNDLRPQRGDVISVHDTSERTDGPLGYGAGVAPPMFGRLEITNVGKGQLRRVLDIAKKSLWDGESATVMIRKRQISLSIDGAPNIPSGTLPAANQTELDTTGVTALRKQEAAPHFIDKDTGLPVLS